MTGSGLVWLPKTPWPSVVSLVILLPLVQTKFPNTSWEKPTHVHVLFRVSMREGLIAPHKDLACSDTDLDPSHRVYCLLSF